MLEQLFNHMFKSLKLDKSKVGEIVVGNSVVSIGLAGGIGAMGRTFAGGEVRQITDLISEGRHKAIERMEQEAQRDGAIGVTGVSTKLGRLAGFTEFLSQGTGVHPYQPGGQHRFFSTAASEQYLVSTNLVKTQGSFGTSPAELKDFVAGNGCTLAETSARSVGFMRI